MYRIVNCSHPLSDDVLAEIAERVQDEVEVVDIKVQIGFDDTPLLPQFGELVDRILAHKPVDAIVPPALSYVAFYVGTALDEIMEGEWPDIIVLKRADGVPPKFVLADIIRSLYV